MRAGDYRRMKTLALLFAALPPIAGCTNTPPPSGNGPAYVRLGQEAHVDGPRVTPLAVIEDSRCPKEVTCVWAGRVRISARIDIGGGSETRELTLGEPQPVADGNLELVEVVPVPLKDRTILPQDYGFRFRFMGGL
jgi:hypothetical protein